MDGEIFVWEDKKNGGWRVVEAWPRGSSNSPPASPCMERYSGGRFILLMCGLLQGDAIGCVQRLRDTFGLA